MARGRLLGLRYLWTLPNTLLGLALALGGLTGGGRARIVGGVVEAHGPGIRRLLERAAPAGFRVLALTLGHVVLARDRGALERTRAHEQIHVRQYETWGPALLPAYLLATLLAGARGGDPYRDNWFERAALARQGHPQARPL
jgi:hypothetical protein